jgi:hypothetical protein
MDGWMDDFLPMMDCNKKREKEVLMLLRPPFFLSSFEERGLKIALD